jgi:thioredoxin reductase/Fe-S-cluster-containing hydrogenase component 2/CRP-like cAMP-binding protein
LGSGGACGPGVSTGMGESIFDVAILGAGPAGLSAAARASQRRLSHIVLEAGERHANTIQQYHHFKHVMSEPSVLPLRSDVQFNAGRRESVLDGLERGIRESNANIRYRAAVTGVAGRRGDFRITVNASETVRAKHVVLALGMQGNLRRLGVPGEELGCVQTNLESPDAYKNEVIIVVGAGDAAIEVAVALASANRVLLLNRGNDFRKAKEGNVVRITQAIAARKVQCLFQTEIRAITQNSERSTVPYRLILEGKGKRVAISCHRVIARLGAIPPRKFVESIGVKFTDGSNEALPALSERFESSVPGVFVIGALAGAPLIKPAMNQGYEVIEHLLGNAVQPADHSVLVSRLKPLKLGENVDWALAYMRKRLHAFANVTPQALRDLVIASRILTPRSGRQIVERGDYSSTVFSVLRGEVHLSAGEGQRMTLQAGQLFGEISLISGRPHQNSAVAGKDCVLLATPHSAVKKLMKADAGVRDYIDRVFIVRALKLFLLPHASAKTIHALADGAKIHRLAAGETLFQQGALVDRLFLLRSGSITLSRRAQGREGIVAYCAAGTFVDVAGGTSAELARKVTARATVASELLSIDHGSFSDVLVNDRVLQDRMRVQQKTQLAGYARMQATPEAGDMLSFLMSNGVGEATNMLVIDETLCVGCDQCEKACAATHNGVSRLDRRAGPSFYSLHLPTSCRHCEHPHCMRDCPPNAISRLPNGEVTIAETCIGCGNCETNCPYGVIQMVEVQPTLTLFERFRGRPQPEAVKTAAKCDMCKDLKGGPACVNACPTGAAIRIHADEIVSLARARSPSIA